MRIFTISVRNILFAMLLAALAVSIALAQAPQGSSGKCPPYSDGKKFDASPIVDAIDTNKDGKMTKEEWQKAEAPEPSWNMFMGKENIKKQGYITRQQFLDETPPNGIDTNCDGKITIQEFLATKTSMGGPGGGPGGGQGGPGGAPGGAPGGPPPKQ
jgi:hypothetical protein